MHVINCCCWVRQPSQPRGCHVCSSSGLDLFNARKRLLFENFVEVSNNLIEKAQALNALIVGLKLNVELREVGDGGEDDAPAVALLVVQLIVILVSGHEVLGNVDGEDVGEQLLVVRLQVLHLLLLLCSLKFPKEIEAICRLRLVAVNHEGEGE